MSDPGRFQDDIDKARDLLNANPPELQRRRAGNGGTIPPVEHRFKPGQSGNPGGRPKRVFSDLITAYLKMEDKRLAREFVRSIFRQACQGNQAAIQLIVSRLDRLDIDLAPGDFEPGDVDLNAQPFLDEDRERRRLAEAEAQERKAIGQAYVEQFLRSRGISPGNQSAQTQKLAKGDIVRHEGRTFRVTSTNGGITNYEELRDGADA